MREGARRGGRGVMGRRRERWDDSSVGCEEGETGIGKREVKRSSSCSNSSSSAGMSSISRRNGRNTRRRRRRRRRRRKRRSNGHGGPIAGDDFALDEPQD